MQQYSGNLFWRKKQKIKYIYPYLTSDIKCDILVVGAGVTGAVTAFYLAKEGLDVVVIDKNIIGFGSTLASTALLEYQIDIDLFKLSKILGPSRATRAFKLCYEAIDDIEKMDKEFEADSEFKRRDSIYFTNKFTLKTDMKKEYEARKNAGFNLDYIEGHKTLNLNNGIRTKNGSATINPYKFTQELIAYLSNFSNVRIYENTRLDTLKHNYDGVVCKTNNDFRIYTGKIIFTSGYETLKYLKAPNVEFHKTFSIVTAPIEKLKNYDTNFTARDTSNPYHYMRFTKDNRIIFGGEDVRVTEKIKNDRYLNEIAAKKYKKLFNSMQRTFNDTEDVMVEFAYNGTLANTRDTLPIIDEIDSMPNCFCNLGFGTNGILYSTIGAKMLKDAVKGYYTKDMGLFSINR